MTLILQARDGHAAPSSATVLTTDCDDRSADVCLRGEIDVSACSRLRAELQRHTDAGRTTIRVDAEGVTFLDCRALGELIRAEQCCRSAAGGLVLRRASRQVQRLLQLTGLHSEPLAAGIVPSSSD